MIFDDKEKELIDLIIGEKIYDIYSYLFYYHKYLFLKSKKRMNGISSQMTFSDNDFEPVTSVDDFSQKTILVNSTENIIKFLDPFLGLIGRLLSRDLIITTYDTDIPGIFMYEKEPVDSKKFRLKNYHRFMNFMKRIEYNQVRNLSN